MENELNGAAEAVTEATPVVENQQESSFEDTMSQVWDKMNPARDDAGKFAGELTAEEGAEPAASDEPDAETTDQPGEKTPETVPPSIDAPNSWSAEMKAKWASLPPDAQQYIAQRESEMHAAITQKGEQVKAFEPIRQTIEQHREVFARNGVSEVEGIQRLLAADRFLQERPQDAVKWLADSYGVDLRQFAGNPAEGDQARAQTPREVLELRQEVNQLKSYLTAQQRQQHDAEQATVAQTVKEFAKDKPHFEKVRKVMGSLMQSGAAETLDRAYEMAVYADPDIRQSILADQQKAEEVKRKAEREKAVQEAKKSATINQRSDKGKTPQKGATLEDTMAAVYDRLSAAG